MGFKIGEKLVYPNHGVTVVEQIGESPIMGADDVYYHLRLLGNNSRLMVPTQNTDRVGLRRLYQQKEIKSLFSLLEQRVPKAHTDWRVGSTSCYLQFVSRRLPEWIREKRINLAELHEIKSLLREKALHSVCESLACPNRTDCFSRGTATFMILGDICTRSCGFCNVTTARPYAPPSIDEPNSVAEAAKRMGLRHVVVTSVTRDDLPAGGARQSAATIRALRAELPDAAVEVLTPDFRGNREAIRM